MYRNWHLFIIDFEGWKKIIPIGKLFQNYGINEDVIIFERCLWLTCCTR